MNLNFKKILFWFILLAVVGSLTGFLIYHFTTKKSLKLISPKENDFLLANEKFRIIWNSRKISKLGITLLKGGNKEDVQWIAQGISADKGFYDWNIFTWQEPRQDYQIVIFEYPWKEGNLIQYSEKFTILGPQFASCDNLSINEEWPFIPSDYPNLKRVFITNKSYNGDLGRLEGADLKCQEEAKKMNLGGRWKAFLGDDSTFAFNRLNLDGIFVEAMPFGPLPENKYCYRLLGKNFNQFFDRILNHSFFYSRFREDFSKNLNLWLGRINNDSLRECTPLYFESYAPKELEERYSFTTTCQNWTTARKFVSGYSTSQDEKDIETGFPVCFTPQGIKTNAVALAGLASGFIKADKDNIINISLGISCSEERKLLCIEQ